MSKKVSKIITVDLSKYNKSAFTLTFVVEVVGIDVFHDCNEGWLDLSSGPVQGMKLQYLVAPGQNCTVDILIWPHVALICYGSNSGWVRTWNFLERRWLTFTISHAFPVRVTDYRDFIASVIPFFGFGNVSSSAKTERSTQVYLPKLSFGERRQFAPVIETEQPFKEFILELIWSTIVNYIPASYLDGLFDVPQPVKDKRHQDAVIEQVQNAALNRKMPNETADSILRLKSTAKSKSEVKDKKKVAEFVKFEIILSGDDIISGTGRIIPFESVGDKPPDMGEVIALIATNGLPAYDDNPVAFVNIGKLTDVPNKALEKYHIKELYTKWTISDEVHSSLPQPVSSSTREMDFNDHHAVPLPLNLATENINMFLEKDYRIEIRGIRSLPIRDHKKFFGYAKGDRDFGTAVPPKQPNRDTDILIGITKIDASQLTKTTNAFIRGEYPIYPPETSLKPLERDGICTNDINFVRMPLQPELVVPAGIILEAQMTLEVSIGVVGCKAEKMNKRYSRLFILDNNSEAVVTLLFHITELNEQVMETGERDDLLTGFVLDTGDKVLFFIEGPRDGLILRIWEITEDFYPHMKPIFSSSAKHRHRLYPEFPMAAMPFNVLKMYVPLSVLLACPPIYARPALPLPTRIAVLKLGRLVASKISSVPSADNMPTTAELRSFILELCVAPRPPPFTMPSKDNPPANLLANIVAPVGTAVQTVQRINWDTTKTD